MDGYADKKSAAWKGGRMKRCENCGAELRDVQDGMKFRGDCGTPVPMEENLEAIE